MSMAVSTPAIGERGRNPEQARHAMPYVNVKFTRGSATNEQKAAVIAGVTEVLDRVLNKAPASTFVVIDEVETEDWGVGGLPVDEYWRRTGTSARSR